MCYTEAALKLTGGLPVGGIWSGTGVSKVGVDYFFTPSVSNVGNNVLTYSFTATNGCSSSATATMIVSNIIPAISLGFDQVIEKNVPVTLTATANLPVTWSTGATGSTLEYTPTTSTTLTARISNGCGSATDDVILIDPCTFSGYYTKSDATFTNPVLSGTLTGGGVFSGVYYIQSKLILRDGDFKFKPGTILIVNGNGADDGDVEIEIGDFQSTSNTGTTLVKIDGTQILSACDKMWGGITIRNGNTLLINQDSQSIRTIISDAQYSIYSLYKSQIRVANTDFRNCWLNFYSVGCNNNNNCSDYIGELTIDNCSFDGNAKFKYPHKASTWYHSAIIATGDYSAWSITNCSIKNTWTGIYFTSSVPPLLSKIRIENSIYAGIYYLSGSPVSKFSLDDVFVTYSVAFPDVSSEFNSVQNFFGLYSKTYLSDHILSEFSLTNCKFINNTNIGINGDYNITGARLVNHSANTSPSIVKNCEFSNLNSGVAHSTASPTVYQRNKFYSCGIGIDYNNIEYNIPQVSSSILKCNDFLNNQLNISTSHGEILYDNSECLNSRLENFDNPLKTDIVDSLYSFEDLNKLMENYSLRDENRLFKSLMRIDAESRKKWIKNIELNLANFDNNWRPILKYFELADEIPKPFLFKKRYLKYSTKDSLNLHWLAKTNSSYAYDACIQLRLAYPSIKCNISEVAISKKTIEFNTDFYLGQNIPNPATNETMVPVYIPLKQDKMFVEIRNVEYGTLIKTIPVSGIGDLNIKITLDNIPAGVYFYTLVVDEKKLATKKMVVLK